MSVPPQRFLTTPWSVVLAAANRSLPDCGRALATLCEVYWYPIYAYLRRQGCSPEEAEDVTQGFFARLLDKDGLEGVGPEKGRFRSFLLVCVKRFLLNERHRARAKKRGGGRPLLSMDRKEAEDRYRLEPVHDLTAERVFERRWALTLLERVLAALADEFEQAGKAETFEQLKAYLVADPDAPPYAEVAARLRISEGAARVAVHRLRERYRRLLREEVARTVQDPDEVDAEIQGLFESLSL